jgi:hypothetical protein
MNEALARQLLRSTNETESGETCSTTVTGMRWRWEGWSRRWKAWPELLHDAADSD